MTTAPHPTLTQPTLAHTTPLNHIRIATRSSILALWQAHKVGGLLEQNGTKVSYVKIVSTGDKILDKPLDEIGGKGLFIKELEQALLEDKADIAVHSLKDLPAKLPAGFKLIALAGFGAARGDLLMMHPRHAGKYKSATEALGNMTTIATGSARRKSYLRHRFPNLKTPLLRGNMQTRFTKLKDSEDWDGIIFAAAVADRLPDVKAFETFTIDPGELTPAAGQGIVGIESKESFEYDLQFLSEDAANQCGTKERDMMRAMGAKCTTPVGCHVYQDESELLMDIALWSDTKKFQATRLSVECTWPEVLNMPGCLPAAKELGLTTP